ncbi:hypothetical protein BDP55DRAFT_657989 [Colletotrichum godetiae]|uniref:Secreted protein n=1 Tax=Colletotrichum godetiae TaxID=1209918 RepID=A0AAJ0EVQ1_9PEZI|nr:uncharacterized protein BDP55DRAFT_657989 [Colletotrichum godetiae]KAK1687895.1 hypothetical protein BDP55DRAFT_657989 [Colletotrichum godetiae]
MNVESCKSIVVILLGACVGLSRPTGLDWLAKAAKAKRVCMTRGAFWRPINPEQRPTPHEPIKSSLTHTIAPRHSGQC